MDIIAVRIGSDIFGASGGISDLSYALCYGEDKLADFKLEDTGRHYATQPFCGILLV